MKTVHFAGPVAVEHAGCGVLIVPGSNEFPEEIAAILLAAKVVTEAEPIVEAEPVVAKPIPMVADPAPSFRKRHASAVGSADDSAATSGDRQKEAK